MIKMVSKTSIILALTLVCTVVHVSSQVTGGLDDERQADDHIRKIVASVSSHMEQKYPTAFTSIEPISYKTQVVAGMNYFVRAIVTEKNGRKVPVHMRIYNPIRGATELTAIKTDVQEKSPLKYFQ